MRSMRRAGSRTLRVVLALAALGAVGPAAAQAGWWDVHVKVYGAGNVNEPAGARDCTTELTTSHHDEGKSCKMAFGTALFPYGRTLVPSIRRDGWKFEGWSGCESVANGVCTVGIPGAWRNGSIDVYAYFKDIKAPDTTIVNGPAGVVSNRSASFTFTSDEADHEGSKYFCKLDANAEEPCDSGKTYDNLIDGTHTFEVWAQDPSGNRDASSAPRTWTVDTQGASTNIVAGPSGLVRSTTARFDFSTMDAATVQCSLDGSTFATCAAPTNHQYAGLSQGLHTFLVRGIDTAGNTGPAAMRQWTVDTIAPDTRIDSGPQNGSTTTATTAKFQFAADPAENKVEFQCELDGGGFGACSGPGASARLAGLEPGTHTFAVRAIDEARNIDATPATRSWTVVKPPNLDVDDDGYQRRPEGPDCDDRNALIHPGARDVPDNGVDENCDGVDARNYDRDRDGYQVRPHGPDCNDAAANIHPGANDIPENGVDEDCDGADRRYGNLGADVRATWKLFPKRTRVVSLVAVRVPAGTTITVRCKGKGCPRKTARFDVARDMPEIELGGSLRKALRKRARVTVRLSKAATKGVQVSYRMRKGKSPVRVDRCLSPVTGTPANC